MYKKIQDIDLSNKKVLLRCDFNVPIENNKILDDNKILASLDTIKYLINQNCKIIILSHLGKVETEADKAKNSLAPVAERLRNIMNSKIIFVKQARGLLLEEKIDQMLPGEIMLLENTRFEDVPNKLESNNDSQLAEYWAELADVFVMDAFGSAHRCHASTYGVAKLLPNCIGLLVQKELETLEKYVFHPQKPFTMMVGGAKVDEKIDLIIKLVDNCDHLLLTGGIANSCLKVLGFNVGESLVTKDQAIIDKLRQLLLNYKDKVMLPLDVIVGRSYDPTYVKYHTIDDLLVDDVISDIGLKTINKYKTAINESATVFINGTAGIYENDKFAIGTQELFNAVCDSKAIGIVGGGDSASAAKKFGLENKFDFVSTGGGATLEYILNGKLSALDAINKDAQ
ncbi:MAG TPA: phosphoglycerate kinase [Bacilli bacterium]|nr:phosphoglycerate kinase [Bacilli bacterium]